jgi:hypothetical protein
MRALKAVLSGFLVASALILAGGWGYTVLAAPAMRGEYYTTTPIAALLALLYTGASVVAGAYIATRIDDTSQTISGFSVAQLFFGFGLVREFWNTGSSWYTVSAVLLVIPCALIGRVLARRLGGNKTMGTV